MTRKLRKVRRERTLAFRMVDHALAERDAYRRLATEMKMREMKEKE